MTMRQKSAYGLSAAALRLTALCAMLLDHLWVSVVPENLWMTLVGRIAFPIFAFQAAEGLCRTRDAAAYRRRMLVFALISELPFNLFVAGQALFPFHQNVLFTLWLGLCAVRQLQQLGEAKGRGAQLRHAAGFVGLMLASVLLLADYGWRGTALVVIFYLLRGRPFEWLGQLAAMAVLFWLTFEGQMMVFVVYGHELQLPTQLFSLLALPWLWCYNGEKGRMPQALRTASYLFYPLHMLLLWAVMRFAA